MVSSSLAFKLHGVPGILSWTLIVAAGELVEPLFADRNPQLLFQKTLQVRLGKTPITLSLLQTSRKLSEWTYHTIAKAEGGDIYR